MLRGSKLRRPTAPRPLLPPALRRPAALLAAGCAAVTVLLALAFAGQSRPDRLDAAVDAAVRDAIGGHPGPLHLLANLGGQEIVTVMTVALVVACFAARRWRGAALAGVAVPAASALTESVLKPLVDRTIGSYPGYPSFPSGHATAMFALAGTCAILLAGPSRPRLPGALRLLLGLGAALTAAAVGTAMVGLGYHYLTDIIAGTAVGVGMVLLTALLIDWAARATRPPRDAPVTSRRDPRSMTGHLVAGEASRRTAGPAA
jgi:membrane-associated phospholipid phosphatase